MNKKSFQKSSYWIFQINIKKKAYKGGETFKKVNILKENIKDRKEKNCRAKCLKELHELLQPFLEKVKNPVSIEIECTADIFTGIYLILNLIFILSCYCCSCRTWFFTNKYDREWSWKQYECFYTRSYNENSLSWLYQIRK